MQSLIRNTAQLKGGTVAAGSKSPAPPVLDKVAYHIQAAMQMIRDDPCGDLKWEQHCNKIYHLLYEAMELVVTQPRAQSALQSDLAAVMGGCDGTTEVSRVPRQSPGDPTTPE